MNPSPPQRRPDALPITPQTRGRGGDNDKIKTGGHFRSIVLKLYLNYSFAKIIQNNPNSNQGAAPAVTDDAGTQQLRHNLTVLHINGRHIEQRRPLERARHAERQDNALRPADLSAAQLGRLQQWPTCKRPRHGDWRGTGVTEQATECV